MTRALSVRPRTSFNAATGRLLTCIICGWLHPPKATPVILTTDEQRDVSMRTSWDKATAWAESQDSPASI